MLVLLRLQQINYRMGIMAIQKRTTRPAVLMSEVLSLAGAGTVSSLEDYRARLEQLGDSAGRSAARPTWVLPIRGSGRVLQARAPVYERFGAAEQAASVAAREAMESSSILEHRALCTGSDEDIDAFMESLKGVDAALSAAWKIRALGTLLVRVLPGNLAAEAATEETRVRERLKKGSAREAALAMEELRSAHVRTLAARLPPATACLVLLREEPEVSEVAASVLAAAHKAAGRADRVATKARNRLRLQSSARGLGKEIIGGGSGSGSGSGNGGHGGYGGCNGGGSSNSHVINFVTSRRPR